QETEPVPRVVLEESFETVGALGRWMFEASSFRAELLERLLAVGRDEDASREACPLKNVAQGCARRFVEEGRGHERHERDLEVRLPFGAHGQPREGPERD